MLLIIKAMGELDFDSILAVYGIEPGQKKREEDLYNYHVELFREKDAFCAVWETDGAYRSSLRIQRYLDGFLLSGLETAPGQRGKGYASSLVAGVIQLLRRSEYRRLYSHVDRKNTPSQNLHKKCGFCKLCDSAHLLDGTVTVNMDTLYADI